MGDRGWKACDIVEHGLFGKSLADWLAIGNDSKRIGMLLVPVEAQTA